MDQAFKNMSLEEPFHIQATGFSPWRSKGTQAIS